MNARGVSTALLIGVAAVGASCTGLEPAAISAGASAAQSGATFFTQGRFTAVELASFTDALDAVHAAATDMSLDLIEDTIEDGRARIVYRDERNQSIVVVIQRRTESVTRVRADVGTFGENGLASLLLRQMSAKLREMEAHGGTAGAVEPELPEN